MIQTIPTSWANLEDMIRRLANGVNLLADGRSNATGAVTLTANQATTTLTDARIGTDTVITLQPTTANAAAEIGAGTLYVSAVTKGGLTLTHANNAQADRTFDYALQG